MAMNLYLVRLDGTYGRYTGVVSDPVLTNMTGKGEPYRDIPNVVGGQLGYNDAFGTIPNILTNTGITFTNPAIEPGAGSVEPYLTATMGVVEADDVSHTPPRQADQDYTFWKFEFATVVGSPQYAYAEFRRGDMICNTAPNTDPAA